MVTPLYSGGYLLPIIIILSYGWCLLPLRGHLPRWAMIRLVLHCRVSCNLVLEHDVVVSTTPMIIMVGIYVCVCGLFMVFATFCRRCSLLSGCLEDPYRVQQVCGVVVLQVRIYEALLLQEAI